MGAVDGCVTTFAVVAGAAGGGLEGPTILILGFANLLADGFSMAAGNYLGAKTVDEELEQSRAEEMRHIREIPEGEKEEIRQIFAAKGFQGELLEEATRIVTGNHELWVKTMLSEELGLRSDQARPVRAALAVFTAFCLAGIVPLTAFLIPGILPGNRFAWSCLATATAFAAIGAVKGRVVARPVWTSSLQTLLLGSTAAALAYGAGNVLARIVGA